MEAWRTIDCAYIDKTFNGESWFRYKEDALRNEPMNTRQETYAAIKKMIATLDDSFTVFWSPKSLKVCGQSGTHNVLTGVGLSIGYPTGKNESVPGLVVIATVRSLDHFVFYIVRFYFTLYRLEKILRI